ncbi:uncharacterized protein LOC106655600 isoform X2 [Trichogramma pretiosum]|uniref:uncharacterized protein LOC106655600 isoform X2 n=1 Tax=Trichogramma pretiosum TaxID=7493 RepID=UPI000C71B2C9|nr:uncharacterized protein LOC106655600 isoform X2 [Trichogramma pretiosum]
MCLPMDKRKAYANGSQNGIIGKRGLAVYLSCFLWVCGNFLVGQVSAHGRLIEPPSRGSMWRYGFDTPHDYNDHESYCGGFTRQWQTNHGRCGICGDPWDSREPRAHELGGKYGKGVIVRRYRTGAVIPVRVELTANHMGYFEFRTCPMTYNNREVNQECLDRYVLRGENGTARYYPGEGNRIFEAYYKLPDGLTCAQCVFQWRYVAGNNWGDCGNGQGAVGCGPQEEFRACADIAIGDEEATLPPRPTRPPTKRPTTTTPRTTTKSSSTTEVPSDYEPTDHTGPFWLYNLVMAGTCLLVVLAVMALLYTYYYHAGRAKQWLMARRLVQSEMHRRHHRQTADVSCAPPPVPPPVAPPRLKKQHYEAGVNHMHI